MQLGEVARLKVVIYIHISYVFSILSSVKRNNILFIFKFLQCSPDYAYGTGGFAAWGIQANSTLIFEIEVLSAK